MCEHSLTELFPTRHIHPKVKPPQTCWRSKSRQQFFCLHMCKPCISPLLFPKHLSQSLSSFLSKWDFFNWPLQKVSNQIKIMAVCRFVRLGLMLLYEKHVQGPQSRHIHYIEDLMAIKIETPLVWSKKERAELQYPWLEDQIEKQIKHWTDLYNSFKEKANCSVKISKEEFFWALQAVRSRAFSGPYGGKWFPLLFLYCFICTGFPLDDLGQEKGESKCPCLGHAWMPSTAQNNVFSFMIWNCVHWDNIQTFCATSHMALWSPVRKECAFC